ncbi:hypothetical protein ABZX56_11215 [Streptomyces parvulus]|uniref:hypothetical protein n=1 Tax=Streptomyces parvulus TaxID=146923 RepID=UPI0033BA9272
MLESFRLDFAGVREVLASPELRQVVDDLAEQVATNVRAQVPAGTPVVVRSYTTDRGAASVTVEDVRAMAWQARDGILTRAAGSAGLEVRAWQQ